MAQYEHIEVPALGKRQAQYVSIISKPHEGIVEIYSRGANMRPSMLAEVIRTLQARLDEFIPWQCEYCLGENHTQPQEHGYAWVRCQHCKKKTKREDLGLDIDAS